MSEKKHPDNGQNKKQRRSLLALIAAILALAIGGGSQAVPWMPGQAGEQGQLREQEQARGQEASRVQQQSEEGGQHAAEQTCSFRSKRQLEDHFKRHGIEMGFASAEDYEAAAVAVVGNPRSLHKLEAEDGDDVYYLEDTNELVIVSTDGFIRTYFCPDDGIGYFNRQ